MLYKIKSLSLKVPGISALHSKILFPWYTRLVRSPRSAKFYPKINPKTYSKRKFYQQVDLARKSYAAWKKTEAENKHQKAMKSYTHPYWRQVRKKIEAYLMNDIDEDYLRHPFLIDNIGWGMAGITRRRSLMLDYLFSQNDSIKKFINRFVESKVGKPILDSVKGFGFSMIKADSIDHIFYLAKIIRELGSPFNSCLELGGGYGNFSRIARLYNSKATLVVLDLPEMLALQQLYYALNFPDTPLVLHHQKNQTIKQGALNLIPVWQFQRLKWQPEVFISTFALTEASQKLREAATQSNFFRAKVVYLQGGQDFIFKSRLHMEELVKKARRNVKILPTHGEGYEILARF